MFTVPWNHVHCVLIQPSSAIGGPSWQVCPAGGPWQLPGQMSLHGPSACCSACPVEPQFAAELALA